MAPNLSEDLIQPTLQSMKKIGGQNKLRILYFQLPYEIYFS